MVRSQQGGLGCSYHPHSGPLWGSPQYPIHWIWVGGTEKGEGKCFHWRLMTVKAWIATQVLLAYKSEKVLQKHIHLWRRFYIGNIDRTHKNPFHCHQYSTRQAMYYNVTIRHVRESLSPWKSNKYYIFVCVCARARGWAWTGGWLRACSPAYPACNARLWRLLWPLWLHHISRHYLTFGTIFEENALNIKCSYFLYFCLKHFSF